MVVSGAVEATFTRGLPLDAQGKIDRDSFGEFYKLFNRMNRLQLYEGRGTLRTLKLSEMTANPLKEALRIEGEEDGKEEIPEASLKQILDMLRRITGTTTDATWGEIADRLGQKTLSVIENMLAHPELMPDSAQDRKWIYSFANNITSILNESDIAFPQTEWVNAEDPKERIARIVRQISPEIDKVAETQTHQLTCSVYLKDPSDMDPLTAGAARMFMIHPTSSSAPPLTRLHIWRFCQQLMQRGELDIDLQPGAVKAEPFRVEPLINNNMLVYTTDPKLEAYLLNCAKQKEKIELPPLARDQSRAAQR